MDGRPLQAIQCNLGKLFMSSIILTEPYEMNLVEKGLLRSDWRRVSAYGGADIIMQMGIGYTHSQLGYSYSIFCNRNIETWGPVLCGPQMRQLGFIDVVVERRGRINMALIEEHERERGEELRCP